MLDMWDAFESGELWGEACVSEEEEKEEEASGGVRGGTKSGLMAGVEILNVVLATNCKLAQVLGRHRTRQVIFRYRAKLLV